MAKPTKGWNPQPARHDHRQYRAGYSDGWHGARFGSGQEDPAGSYRVGFDSGRVDRENAERGK